MAPNRALSASAALSAPTLGGDVRLRRPSSLPRAVRESFPPRSAGEVPGLDARGCVVAGAPARAHGRLRAGVLGRPERRRADRPLPALRALRARGVALLLDVTAVGVP